MSTPDDDGEDSEVPLLDPARDTRRDGSGCASTGLDHGLLGGQRESPEALAERRAADVAVVAALDRIGYDPKHVIGQAYTVELRETGYGRLTQLNDMNQIRPRARRLGVALPPPPACWPQEASSLILEAVYAAAPRFIESGVRKWRADRGASLTTWYITT